MTQPRGLLAIAVIVDMGSRTEVELRRLTVASQSITFKGTLDEIFDRDEFRTEDSDEEAETVCSASQDD